MSEEETSRVLPAAAEAVEEPGFDEGPLDTLGVR